MSEITKHVNRYSRILIATVTVISMAPALATPAVAAPQQGQTATYGPSNTAREAMNKGVILGLFEALNRNNLNQLTTIVHPNLIQHYPEIADGEVAYRKYHEGLRTQFPQLRFNVERMIAQNDLVMTHSHFVEKPGELGIAKMNLFKIQHGKITEHWEVNQAVPPPSNVGNDMFSTLSSPQVSRPLPLSTEKASERVGRAIFAEAINQPDDNLRLKAIKRYIGNNAYFQHFPGVPNGPESLQQFVHDAFAVQPGYLADVKTVVAEGDLVVLVVHLTKLFDIEDGVAFDILRVRGGQLLEHWSVTQPTPAVSANPHTMY